MTDSNRAASAVSAIQRRLEAFEDLVRRHIESPGFMERLKRWKERTATIISAEVSEEEAQKFRGVKLSYDSLWPESFNAMLNSQEAFLLALADDIADHPDSVLSSKRFPEERRPTRNIQRVFISHAESDRPIADFLRDTLEDMDPDIQVFIASRPGHIQTGEEWWPRIKIELRNADGFIIVLTPQSVDRKWISFETGAAWMTSRPLLTLSAGGLEKSNVPMPLSAFQISSLEDAGEATAAFRSWNLILSSPQSFSERMSELAEKCASGIMSGWQGIEFEGRYFAWDGPNLYSLEDRDPEPTPLGLTDALRDASCIPSYGLPGKLEQQFARGCKRVFETDKKRWRRLLLDATGEQVLLVRPEESG